MLHLRVQNKVAVNTQKKSTLFRLCIYIQSVPCEAQFSLKLFVVEKNVSNETCLLFQRHDHFDKFRGHRDTRRVPLETTRVSFEIFFSPANGFEENCMVRDPVLN